MELPPSWERVLSNEPTGAHVESIWHRRPPQKASILISAAVPAPRRAPIASAGAVRAQLARAPTYREISLQPISLAGRPAARWIYELKGRRRVVYFFTRCEVLMKVYGTAAPATFDSLAEDFGTAASSVAVRCP